MFRRSSSQVSPVGLGRGFERLVENYFNRPSASRIQGRKERKDFDVIGVWVMRCGDFL